MGGPQLLAHGRNALVRWHAANGAEGQHAIGANGSGVHELCARPGPACIPQATTATTMTCLIITKHKVFSYEAQPNLGGAAYNDTTLGGRCIGQSRVARTAAATAAKHGLPRRRGGDAQW